MRALVAGLVVLTLTPLTQAEPVDYLREIKPLLLEKCLACHGAVRQKNDLRVDTVDLLLKGGASGPAIERGKSGESLLIEVLTGKNGLRMPPEGEGTPFSKAQVELFKRWIDAGATGPKEEEPQQDPRQYWSFQPPVKAPVPQPKDAAWAANPIDAFVAAEHERLHLQPDPIASRETLLRRVTVDLTGLPPTREELRAFLADESPAAYQTVVDRLLSSPEYGERWGRHWMDVWRYSDPFGFNAQIRYSQKHVWRWRDWIVESLNADAGFDRMITEMLAGDEVAPTDPQVLRATGFLGRNWYRFNRNEWLRETVDHTALGFLGLTLKCARCHDHKFDPVSQVDYYRFRAFFETHDVRIDSVPGEIDVEQDGVAHAYDGKLTEPTYLFTRGDERTPDKDHPLTPGVPDVLGTVASFEAVKLPVEAWYPALRPFAIDDAMTAARKQVQDLEAKLAVTRDTLVKARQKRDELAVGVLASDPRQSVVIGETEVVKHEQAMQLLERQLGRATLATRSLEARIRASVAQHKPRWSTFPQTVSRDEFDVLLKADSMALAKTAAAAERTLAVATAEVAVCDVEGQLENARYLADLQASQKQMAAAESNLAGLRTAVITAQEALKKDDADFTVLGPAYPVESSGRRLALARWMTRPGNPRTARVAVNHVWLRHFGKPLVASMADFGLRSKGPSHPALLDWLAVDFAEHGWSFKHLHRLIVTSRTYQLSSQTKGSPNTAIDPENRYLWRANTRRVEAEVVRDSLLAASGQLDRTRGGPPVLESAGLTSHRRSLYFRLSTEHRMEFLDLFDLASPNECYERRESVMPQQALAMINSTLAISQSRVLAAKLMETLQKEPGGATDEAFVTAAFEHLLTRRPTPGERSRTLQFLSELISLRGSSGGTPLPGPDVDRKPANEPAQRARENLILVLLNHTDFVTVR